MGNKIFGPVRGAGTQIQEKPGDKPITAGALGWRGYAGILEKGPTNKLLFLNTPELAKRRVGSYIDDSQCPDAIYDSFNTAAGAGGVLAVRVTDGNEAQAQLNLYARRGSLLTLVGRVKAHNGGRWGGKLKRYVRTLSDASDVTNTTITTGDTTNHKKNEWAGGYAQLSGVGTKMYPIVSNTAAGVITVASDQTMADDLAAGDDTDLVVYLTRENGGKAVSIELLDGDSSPDTEFGLAVYVDGALVSTYQDLSMDPTARRYWVNIINNDTANYEIVAEQIWSGAITADIRPANICGIIDSVTTTILTAKIHDFTINSPDGADPTMSLGATNDTMVAQKITITMSDPTTGAAVSDKFGPLGTVTLATQFNPTAGTGGATKNKWVPIFTITAGLTALVSGDILVINYKPFIADALINGSLYPDKVNAKRTKFRITDNDHKTITVADGSDLTGVGATSDTFMVVAPMEMEGGRDGNADIADTNYIQAWDPNSSLFNRVFGLNMGLVKFATPGITSTLVQKAGVAYAAARNHQYRIEIPSGTTTDNDADAYVNETIGRSPYMAVSFPSYAYVLDPAQTTGGRLKLSTRTGEIHGREARIAVDNLGYHKAEAGLEAILPAIVKLTTEDRPLDEELLNPRGIGIIKSMQGNFVIWGDRLPSNDPEWMWKHQREQMSYYENVLRESFDWIIFAIHNAETRQRALQALRSFFRSEYRNGSLDTDRKFEEAAVIKLDRETNPDDVKAAGNMVCHISLALPNTVERFIVVMSRSGIFESVS